MEQQAKSKPTNVLSLPPEILNKIFSLFSVTLGISTIQAVLRTCKQFHHAALPISVGIFRNTVRRSKGERPCSSVRNIQFLHYILVSKPWLANHVETVIMGTVTRETLWGREHQNLCTEEDLTIYQQKIETFLRPLSKKAVSWSIERVEDLKRGHSDAQFALILLACPNIRTILYENSTNQLHMHRLLSLVHDLFTAKRSLSVSDCSNGNGAVIPLSNVEDIFHESNRGRHSYQHFYNAVPTFFALPRLRVYECMLEIGSNGAADKLLSLPPRSSPVEEINLRNAFITSPLLRNMLSACKELKKLEYIRSGFEAPNVIMPRDIIDAILPHAHTLEYLYIGLNDGWYERSNWEDCPEKLYLGVRLRQMHALKHLTLSMQALTGMLASQPRSKDYESDDSVDSDDSDSPYYHDINVWMPESIPGAARLIDCLPENLEYLKIHGCGVRILKPVLELIDVMKLGHRFTKLTYLGLLFEGYAIDDLLNRVKTYSKCRAPGLFLDIGYQTFWTTIVDAGILGSTKSGNSIRDVASRIYSENYRRQYLQLRGSTKGLPFLVYEDDPNYFEE